MVIPGQTTCDPLRMSMAPRNKPRESVSLLLAVGVRFSSGTDAQSHQTVTGFDPRKKVKVLLILILILTLNIQNCPNPNPNKIDSFSSVTEQSMRTLMGVNIKSSFGVMRLGVASQTSSQNPSYRFRFADDGCTLNSAPAPAPDDKTHNPNELTHPGQQVILHCGRSFFTVPT